MPSFAQHISVKIALISLLVVVGSLGPQQVAADDVSSCSGIFCGSWSGGFFVGSGGGGSGTSGGGGGTDSNVGDSGKLVPCGTVIEIKNKEGKICYVGECNVCDLQRLAIRILGFLIWAGTIVAALLFVNAGVLYVFSPANPGNIARAHKIFLNTLVGLIIVLAAFMLIDVIMKTLYGDGKDMKPAFGVWNELLCEGENRVHCFPKLEQITIKAAPSTPSVVPLPTAIGLNCESQLGGWCAMTCAGGNPANYTSSCSSNAALKVCCMPKTTGDSCTLANGAAGTCQQWSFCESTGEMTGGCKNGTVCCPNITDTRSSTYRAASDAPVGERDIISQLIVADIDVVNGQPVAGLKQSTIDGVVAMKKACDEQRGSACDFVITSATGGVNGVGTGHSANSLHYQGVKLDLRLTESTNAYIQSESSGFRYAGERTGDYPGPIYRNSTMNVECVKESNHWDCKYL